MEPVSAAFRRVLHSDVARYQLLFQRTIPGFEPSPESYAPAQRALGHLERLALNGITDSATSTCGRR